MFPLRQDRPWVDPPCSSVLNEGIKARYEDVKRRDLVSGEVPVETVTEERQVVFGIYSPATELALERVGVQAVVCGEFAEQMLPEGGVGSRDLERQFVREERLRDLIRAGRGPSEVPVRYVQPPARQRLGKGRRAPLLRARLSSLHVWNKASRAGYRPQRTLKGSTKRCSAASSIAECGMLNSNSTACMPLLDSTPTLTRMRSRSVGACRSRNPEYAFS